MSSNSEAERDTENSGTLGVANSADIASSSTPSPWTPKVRQKFETKAKSEYLDPCQGAANKSIHCLHRNGGDRSFCQDYFQAYRDCKKIWLDKRHEERAKRRLLG